MQKSILFSVSAFLLGIVFMVSSCKPEDTTPPQLTLNGGNAVMQPLPTVAGHGTWTEPGWTATDNKDGNLTGHVNVFGTVNPNTKGTYTLTYSVKDAAGNVTTQNRVVNIFNHQDTLAGAYSVYDTTTAPIHTTIQYTANMTSDNYVDYIMHFDLFEAYSNNSNIYCTFNGSNIAFPRQMATGINGSQTHIFAGSGTATSLIPPITFLLNYTDKDSTTTPGSTTTHRATFIHQ